MRQQISILWIIVAGLLTAGFTTIPIPRHEALPQRVQLCNYFACYNLPGVDWTALSDKKNNRILHACLRGTTLAELETFDMPDLNERLQTLKKGKLIAQSHDKYFLAHPAVVGQKRQEIQSVIEKTAPKLVPVAKRAIQKIKPHLQGREEMMYHILWSGIMDGGFAWETLRLQLSEDLRKGSGSVDLRTAWWIYPGHPFHVGTNTFGSSDGSLVITAQKGFTPAHTILGDIKEFKIDLIRSSITGAPLGDRAIPQSLRDYGLVGVDNRSRLFVVCSDSDLFPVAVRLSTEFAQSALANLDIQSIAGMLNVTPEQALVIAYHHLCYEVLGKLSDGGDLAIPNAAETSAKDVRSLVSFFLMTPAEEFLEQDGH